jgi:Xaa-Pro aminopeptidase
MKPDYFIPAQGEPRGLVHQVEPHVLHPLPGARIPYARWQEQEAGLRTLLQPWTCFSVEPALYLPDFGVRTEVNVFVEERGARVTGEMQMEFVRLC